MTKVQTQHPGCTIRSWRVSSAYHCVLCTLFASIIYLSTQQGSKLAMICLQMFCWRPRFLHPRWAECPAPLLALPIPHLGAPGARHCRHAAIPPGVPRPGAQQLGSPKHARARGGQGGPAGARADGHPAPGQRAQAGCWLWLTPDTILWCERYALFLNS